jgi:hypothetical protein
MQHARSRTRSLRWVGRGALASLAGLIASGVQPARPALAVDGAGNAIAVFGSSYSWHLAGGSWGPATPLPAGSSGGLAAADPAGTFVYADSGGNAFTFGAAATSFGTGSGCAAAWPA